MRGNPHAAFDAAGAGNVAWSRWCDTRRRKSEPTGNTNFDLNRRASPRPYLRGAEGETLRPTHPYIPIGRGFLYLVAVLNWASRAVLSWRLSNTMDASFCVAALEEALARYGKPEIFNTDRATSSPAPISPAC